MQMLLKKEGEKMRLGELIQNMNSTENHGIETFVI